jgi:hypothetical protein
MNIDCREYLLELDFGICSEDIRSYDEAFTEECAALRAAGEIISKDTYTNEELLFYTNKVMGRLYCAGNLFVRKLKYLMDEGLVRMDGAGTIIKNEVNFDPLRESDFTTEWVD